MNTLYILSVLVLVGDRPAAFSAEYSTGDACVRGAAAIEKAFKGGAAAWQRVSVTTVCTPKGGAER